MDIKYINQIVCSSIKIDKRLKYYGNANVRDLSLLSLVYKQIFCDSSLEFECRVKLENIAQALTIKNPDICNVRGDSAFVEGSTDPLQLLVTLNNPPTIDDIGINFGSGLVEYTFSSSQFQTGFSDPDGDTPETVRIVTLPSTGTLYYNDIPIVAGYLFDISNSNKLTYIREAGLYIDTFVFQTSDNNSTNKLFSNMATFTITVDGAINQPPTIGDGAQTTAYATTIVFTRAMFTTATTPPYSDPEADAAATLKITSLPAQGNIKLSGVNISVNDEFDFTTDIDSGNLTYVPDPGITTTHMPAFTFEIADAGSGQFSS